MILNKTHDPMGQAFTDYLDGTDTPQIKVLLDVAEEETIDPAYFFREYDDCPEIEQRALAECKGRVLDVGAGAGSHSLYLQQNGFDVTSIDISPLSVEVMKKRGLENVSLTDYYNVTEQRFDTLMFLMNGIGLVAKLDDFDKFFAHARSLLNPNGQILLDSSDLIYLFEQDDGSYLIDLNQKYHGEVEFNLSYKDVKGEPFDWLYVAYELLADAAERNGFACELILEGPHYDYLARLTL
jgi:SAM-dependent methyltransferase